MSKELDNDYCPSCRVPFTEHLGLVGTCKLKLEAEKDKDNSIRDWCEMDTEIKAITAKYGIPDCHPTCGYGFKTAEECVQEMADKLQSEIHRLRSALAHIAEYATVKAMAFRDCDPETVLGFIEALSPSAPAETNSVQTGSKSVIAPAGQAAVIYGGEYRAAGDEWYDAGDQFQNDQGDWCTLESRTRGFKDLLYRRRFHPATTNQDQIG